jgi:hypothetical protein
VADKPKKTIRIVRKGGSKPPNDEAPPEDEQVESVEDAEEDVAIPADAEEGLEEDEEEDEEEIEPRLSLAKHSAPSASHEWGEKEQTVSAVGERFAKPRGGVNRAALKKMKARSGAKRVKITASAARARPAAEPEPEPEPEARPVAKEGGKPSVRIKSRSGKQAGRRSSRSKRSRSTTGGSRKRGRRKKKGRRKSTSSGPAIIGLCLLAVLLVVLGVFGSYVVRGPKMGNLGVVTGTVTVLKTSAGAEPIPAEAGMRLGQNYVISTIGTGSETYIRYPDGGVMHIEDGTKIKIGRTKESSIKYLAKWVEVLDGPPTNRILLEIPRQEPGLPLEVRTVNAIISINDDNLLLTSSFDADRIDMTEGEVQVVRKFDKQKGKVKAGYFLMVGENLSFNAVHRTGDTTVMNFAFVEPSSGEPIEDYDILKSSVILYPGDLEMEPALLARTEPPVVGSVKFTLEGTDVTVIDNEAPYIFRGSADAPDGAPWRLTQGVRYQVLAVAYSMKDGVGKPSRPRAVEINVVSLD